MADILIADDSSAIRFVLKEILQIGEHNVVAEASDGAEAVDFYREHVPQILLLDLAMPKKDGFQVVQEVIEIDPKAKIILITASDDQNVIRQCLDGGAISHISKPFVFKEVLDSITKIVEN